MRIVTNPGSNLSPAAIERYRVELTPQIIMVDGVAHDTRDLPSFETIDGWVRGAKAHPYVVGTTAAEYVALFRRIARDDERILAVTTSRRIIGSHDAAISALRTMHARPEHGKLQIGVADSGMTDLGAGLAVVLAGEIARGGGSITDAERALATFREVAVFRFVPESLDYLVKGGRAHLLKAWIADWLGLRPVIGFVDGEASVVAKLSSARDRVTGLVDLVTDACGAGEPVWAAVMHGGGAGIADAERCAATLRARLDVRFCTVRPLSPSIYLHAGHGALGAVALPLRRLAAVLDRTPVV